MGLRLKNSLRNAGHSSAPANEHMLPLCSSSHKPYHCPTQTPHVQRHLPHDHLPRHTHRAQTHSAVMPAPAAPHAADMDGDAAAGTGGGGQAGGAAGGGRRQRPDSASASHMEASLRREVRALTATRDALAAQLAEVKASARVQRLAELQVGTGGGGRRWRGVRAQGNIRCPCPMPASIACGGCGVWQRRREGSTGFW